MIHKGEDGRCLVCLQYGTHAHVDEEIDRLAREAADLFVKSLEEDK